MELGTCLMCLYDSVCSCIAIHREATVKNHETGNKKKPTTPGDILLYEYLEPLDLKINELAELLHVHRNSVSALINNNRKLTTEMAFRLAKVFDTTVDFRAKPPVRQLIFGEVENNMRTQGKNWDGLKQWLNIWHAVKSVQKKVA